jgi:type IV secretory pathway TrbF-like protein
MNATQSRAISYAPAPSSRDISEHVRELGGQGRLNETPYTMARRESDGLLGLALLQGRLWRLAFAASGVLLAGSIAGNVYQGLQPKLVPHIIEVDGLGNATYRGPAGRPLEPSEAVTRRQLAQFIEITRTVSSDLPLYRQRLIDMRAMLTSNGYALYKQWGDETKPLELGRTQTTAVEIVSAVPLSKQTWQIDWQERTWDRDGNPMGKPVLWRAMLKIVLNPPGSEKQIIANPLGIYIDEFHWDRLLSAK